MLNLYFLCVSSANSSDSEELSAGESIIKSQPAKSVPAAMKSQNTKSPARTQSPGKCGKNGEKDSDLKEQNNRLPKLYKWSFQMCKYGFLVAVPALLNVYLLQPQGCWRGKGMTHVSLFCNKGKDVCSILKT